MTPFGIALLATCTFALAVVGVRLMRTTGLEKVESVIVPAEADEGKDPFVARFVDAIGVRWQQTLLRIYGTRRLDGLQRRLDSAGHPEGLTVRGYVRRQAGFVLVGVLGCLVCYVLGYWWIGVPLLVMFAGWMDLWLRAVAKNRQASIAQELPDFLDILAVTVTAGLSLQGAMERVTSYSDTPLAEEIRRVLEDIRLGVPRRRALEELRERNTAPAIESWVTAMLQAEELGTPLSSALTEIAVEVRRERAQHVRREAAKASPKVSLVITLFIVPGALLLILAAMVLSQMENLRGLFG